MHTRKLAIVVQPNISLMDNQVTTHPPTHCAPGHHPPPTTHHTRTTHLTPHTTHHVTTHHPPTHSLPAQAAELNALAARCGEPPWASVLHSEDKTVEQVNAALRSTFHVLFVSAERALVPSFMRRLGDLHGAGRLLLVAVDEAHVIAECSVVYRQQYRRLGELRQVRAARATRAASATQPPPRDEA